MVNGERKCPKKHATLSEKLAMLNPREEHDSKKKIPHQIDALTFEELVEAEDAEALEVLGEGERETVEWLLESYFSGLSEPLYPSSDEVVKSFDSCAVSLEADYSTPRRVHVTMTLEESGLVVPVVVLADTGSEANLLDERFARRHGMTFRKKETPLICTSYDGKKGLEIELEWTGQIRGVGQDGRDEVFDIILQVTRLGGQDVIVGCHWMRNIGCTFMLGKERSYLKLGEQLIVTSPKQKESPDTLICKIDLVSFECHDQSLPSSTVSSASISQSNTTLDTDPEISKFHSSPPVSNLFPSQKLSPALEKICTQYSHIFSLQKFVLPPHRSHDIAIELKPGCEAPFGGLYNLALSEQLELKTYLNDLLQKGFILPLKSAAAAPTFFCQGAR